MILRIWRRNIKAMGMILGLGVFSAISSAVPAQTQLNSSFNSEETLTTLLKKGEMILVESNPDATLKQVTAITLVKKPIDQVWQRLIDYPGYMDFMPKLAEIKVLKREANVAEVEIDVEIPGPNYRYVSRNTEDAKNYVLTQKQISGTLTGSYWSWQLVSLGPSITLVYRSAYTNVTGESWIARQLDDSSHTLDYGVNVSSCLIEVKALKRVMEQAK